MSVFMADADYLVLLELVKQQISTGRMAVVNALPSEDEPAALVALIVVEDEPRSVPPAPLKGLAVANGIRSTGRVEEDQANRAVRLPDVNSFSLEDTPLLQDFDAAMQRGYLFRQLVISHGATL